MTSCEVRCFFEKESCTCQYVVADAKLNVCAIIDSVYNFDMNSGRLSSQSCDEMLEYIKEKNYVCEWILETHVHADHVSGAACLKKKLIDAGLGSARVGIGQAVTTVQNRFKATFDMHELATDGSQFDVLLVDNEEFKIGELAVKVLHTPGHTLACVSYIVDGSCVFVGDTFFAPDAGTARCDFPGGSAKQLWNSLQQLLALGDEKICYLCHDYSPGGRKMICATTMGEQRTRNIHLVGKDETSFVDLREARDKTLSIPKLIIPSLQINIAAGSLPPKREGDAHVHLKLPINVLKKPV